MKQLSLFDLPSVPGQASDVPSFWWILKYKPLFEQTVADFIQSYQVSPIFHLSWPRRQAFLSDPAHAVIIDRTTGQLTLRGQRKLWELDYGSAKAFRPQDVAPQITSIIFGAESRESWRPMIMCEITVPESKVEYLLARLSAEGVFSLHWPAFQDRYMFRLFGSPAALEELRYQVATV